MKTKFLLLFLMVNVSFALLGQSYRYDTIRYAREYYQKRVDAFKKEPVKKGRVILIGNSITEFGDWKNLLHDSTIINRGVAGDNTFGVLDRLDEVIFQMPSKLFVEVGINDISQNIPVEITAKNIFHIASRVKKKSPHTEIYVFSVLPTNDNVKNDYPDAYNKNSIVLSLNRQLQQGSKENQFTYIDLTKIFSDNMGKLNTKFAEEDGLHLNHVGYAAWVNLLKTNGYWK
jgi:lysophospholipase L1-like esterase